MSIKYVDQLAEAGIEPSVGSVGYSYDNAWARPLTVSTRQRSSLDAAFLATVRWSSPPSNGSPGFIHCSMLDPIGTIPPAEANANFYAALEQPGMTA